MNPRAIPIIKPMSSQILKHTALVVYNRLILKMFAVLIIELMSSSIIRYIVLVVR